MNAIGIAGIGIPSLPIAVIALAVVIYLQSTTRPLRERSWVPVAIFLIVIGAIDAASLVTYFMIHLPGQPVSVVAYIGWHMASDLVPLVIAVALAIARAYTMRIWADGDRVLRRGTVWTALLWLAALLQHQAMIFTGDLLAAATLLVYLGLGLIAQQRTLIIRARRRGLLASATS